MTTLALFCGVGSTIVETHPILGILRLASIECVTSAIGAISLVLVPSGALISIRMVVRLRMFRLLLVGRSSLRPRCGGPLRSSTTRLTSSLMVKMRPKKNSLGDGEELVKFLTYAAGVSGCWPWRFKLVYISSAKLSASSTTVALAFRTSHRTTELSKGHGVFWPGGGTSLGPSKRRRWVCIAAAEETLEFIVVSFLGSGEGPAKSEDISVEASRKGVRATQLESVQNGFKLCKKVFDIGKNFERWRKKA